MIVNDVPAVAVVGVKLVIVGTPAPVATVKFEAEVAVPAGVVTLIVPVVPPVGTVATIWVAVADTIVAEVPLKLTESWLIVVLKPVPVIVTDVPTGPLFGVKFRIDVWLEVERFIASRLPTGSY